MPATTGRRTLTIDSNEFIDLNNPGGKSPTHCSVDTSGKVAHPGYRAARGDAMRLRRSTNASPINRLHDMGDIRAPRRCIDDVTPAGLLPGRRLARMLRTIV
jgi:hypothetical protein